MSKKLICLILFLFTVQGPVLAASEKMFIGNDDRRRVTSSHDKLSKRVGLLETEFDDGTFGRCTGMLIDEYLVLTAAHCFSEGSKKAESVTFYPNIRNVESERIRSYYVSKVWINKKYYAETLKRKSDDPITDYEIEHDMAIAKLDRQRGQKDAGDRYGYESFAYHSNAHKRHEALTYGYPGDKKQDTLWKDENCFSSPLNENVYDIECDIYAGQSGGPILIEDEKDGDIHVYGVVSAFNARRGQNYATRIRKPLFRDIMRLKRGETGLENFFSLSLSVSNESRISVRNKCFEELQIAVKYFDSKTGQWETKAWYRIDGRETKRQLIWAQGQTYYYYASTLDGEDVWRGRYDRGALRGMGNDGFRKKKMDYNGDHYLILTCN